VSSQAEISAHLPYYHPAYKQWITEDGEFDILIGASSADIRCTLPVTLQSTLELPSILNRDSTMREWVEDPRGIERFSSFISATECPDERQLWAAMR